MSTNQTFLGREREGGAEAESSRGPSAYQPNALLLGQTGSLLLLVECYFTSTETVGLLGTGAQDGHLDFHTAPELLCWLTVHERGYYTSY